MQFSTPEKAAARGRAGSKLPQSRCARQPPLGWGLWQYGKVSGESAALRIAGSPSPSSLRDATSPKGRGLGKEMKFAWTAKGSHFEGRLPPAGGRCRAATKGGIWHRAAMTERVGCKNKPSRADKVPERAYKTIFYALAAARTRGMQRRRGHYYFLKQRYTAA